MTAASSKKFCQPAASTLLFVFRVVEDRPLTSLPRALLGNVRTYRSIFLTTTFKKHRHPLCPSSSTSTNTTTHYYYKHTAMGGHSAWRKRVARGETAKGAGGAICRHRPHLGRKGKDLILNRKGHIAGGNPKKKKKTKSKDEVEAVDNSKNIKSLAMAAISVLLVSSLGFWAWGYTTKR